MFVDRGLLSGELDVKTGWTEGSRADCSLTWPTFASVSVLQWDTHPITRSHKLSNPIELLQEPLILIKFLYLNLVVWESRSSTGKMKDRCQCKNCTHKGHSQLPNCGFIFLSNPFKPKWYGTKNLKKVHIIKYAKHKIWKQSRKKNREN